MRDYGYRNKRMRKDTISYSQGFGIALFVFSVVVLLCLITGGALFGSLGREVNAFVIASLGYFSFAFFGALAFFSAALFSGLRPRLPLRPTLPLTALFFFTLLALQLITSAQFYEDSQSFSGYVAACYRSGLGGIGSSTAGGAAFAAAAYPLRAGLGAAGSYILLGVLILASAFSAADFKAGIARREQRTSGGFAPPVRVSGVRDYDLNLGGGIAESAEREGGGGLQAVRPGLFVANFSDASAARSKRRGQESPHGFNILLGSEKRDPPASVGFGLSKISREEEEDAKRQARNLLFGGEKPSPLSYIEGFGLKNENDKEDEDEDEITSVREQNTKDGKSESKPGAEAQKPGGDYAKYLHRNPLRPDAEGIGDSFAARNRKKKGILDNQTDIYDSTGGESEFEESGKRAEAEALKKKYEDYLPKYPKEIPPIINGEEFKKNALKPYAGDAQGDAQEDGGKQEGKERRDMFGGYVQDNIPKRPIEVDLGTGAGSDEEIPEPKFPEDLFKADAEKSGGGQGTDADAPEKKAEDTKPHAPGFGSTDADFSAAGEGGKYGLPDNIFEREIPPNQDDDLEPEFPDLLDYPEEEDGLGLLPHEKGSLEHYDAPKKPRKASPYTYPPVSLLTDTFFDPNEMTDNFEDIAAKLEQTLEDFKISAKVVNITPGPAVTRYELRMPAGISVNKVVSRADDIAMSVASRGEVRIEAPIPGKSLLGIEIPNSKRAKVGLREVLDTEEFRSSKSLLTIALGKDIAGKNIIADIAKMPHLLIAGSTGSGKSVCLNSIIMSILYKAAPEDVRIILIDPKRVEFNMYDNLPHLMLKNVITDSDMAISAFGWAIGEMNRRFELFKEKGAKDIASYNDRIDPEEEEKLFRVVIIVDELAELMMGKKRDEMEDRIKRLSQLSRAAGIHLVLATQRPSVDIITGVIKSNLPSRVSFRVISQVDSRTVLDMGGAEKLLGDGDMMYMTGNMSKPMRLQGPFVSINEVDAVVEFVRDNNEAYYDTEIENKIKADNKKEEEELSAPETETAEDSENYRLMLRVLKMGIEAGQVSISMVQRKFNVGYARAGKIIDELERLTLISPFDGSKPRQVLIGMDEFERRFGDVE